MCDRSFARARCRFESPAAAIHCKKPTAARREVNWPTAAPDILESADGETQAKLDLPAAYRGRIHSIDGALVSWYGPRIAEPFRALAGIFANL
jgi:hypothetical protein